VGSNPSGGMGVWLLWLLCGVLSGSGLCDGLITRPEKSYRLWCVVVCDIETSWMRRPWPTGGCRATKKTVKWNSWNIHVWYSTVIYNFSNLRIKYWKHKQLILISPFVPCSSILILTKFYLFTNWCTSDLSYKTILKFTLKQLRHVSLLQLHHHQGAH